MLLFNFDLHIVYTDAKTQVHSDILIVMLVLSASSNLSDNIGLSH